MIGGGGVVAVMGKGGPDGYGLRFVLLSGSASRMGAGGHEGRTVYQPIISLSC